MMEDNIIENSTVTDNITKAENKKAIAINNASIATNSDIIKEIVPNQIDNSLFHPTTDHNKYHNNYSHSHNKNNRSKEGTRWQISMTNT